MLLFFYFPLDDDVETDVVEQDWNDQFKHIEEPSLGVFSVPSFDLCGETQNEKPNLVNNFSASELSDIDRRNIGTNLLQCQTYNPVSVFESSSYSSDENSNFELPLIPTKRPRSKRRRLSSFNELSLIQFIPPFQKHRCKTFYAGKAKVPVADVNVPVIGGHAGVTILPLFSQATPSANLNAGVIAKEENVATNVIGNRCSLSSNNALNNHPNGQVKNKFCGNVSFTADTQKNLINADYSSRVSCENDALVQQKDSDSLVEKLNEQQDPCI
ncbi:hypothetical protein KIW84_073578 [Lathyrus oleraceus]|uniref:Lactate/malate dehydrogenase C-terminal domain-containing protein n=1 Tax=Pisum sativum TaxID=3888 RepID=A0A9D4VPK5_PEA|nr:hypothetical protein KIW84_073578 [Pisum sativum]